MRVRHKPSNRRRRAPTAVRPPSKTAAAAAPSRVAAAPQSEVPGPSPPRLTIFATARAEADGDDEKGVAVVVDDDDARWHVGTASERPPRRARRGPGNRLRERRRGSAQAGSTRGMPEKSLRASPSPSSSRWPSRSALGLRGGGGFLPWSMG
eukprot:scaffold336_cov384-Prasinococcus_capsulatus_cf.AAC.5